MILSHSQEGGKSGLGTRNDSDSHFRNKFETVSKLTKSDILALKCSPTWSEGEESSSTSFSDASMMWGSHQYICRNKTSMEYLVGVQVRHATAHVLHLISKYHCQLLQ